MNTPKQTHPSYGIITLSRISSNRQKPLYGSPMGHSTTIGISIYGSYMQRHISTDWYHRTGKLIEIEMSPSQWAEFISSVNIGDGVPCTIRFDKNGLHDYPNITPPSDVFESELKQDIENVARTAQLAAERWNELSAKKTLNKADKDEIRQILESLYRTLSADMPYVQRCFMETMQKTVENAKGEVEAWTSNLITSLGKKCLRTIDTQSAPQLVAEHISYDNKNTIRDEITALTHRLKTETCPETAASLYEAIFQKQHILNLWEQFGHVPMNPETECIEATWYGFPAGTHREQIWKWFETQFHISVATDSMGL